MPKSGLARAALLLVACSAIGAWIGVQRADDVEGFGSYPLGMLALALLQVTGVLRLAVGAAALVLTAATMWATGQSALESVGYSAGGVAAAGLALAVVRTGGGRMSLRTESDLARIVVASLAGALLVAASSAGTGALAGVPDLRSISLAALLNMTASLLLWLPLAMERPRPPGLAGPPERILQWTLVLTATVAVCAVDEAPAFAYVVLALLGWAGLRFSLLETLVQLIAVRLVTMAFTTYGRGPFSRAGHEIDLPPDLRTAYAQLFLITCSVAVIALNLSSTRLRAATQREALAKAGAVADTRLSTVFEALEAERSALEELREVDRVKDAFVSTVSHELRTPITNIIGYTELLDEGDYGELSPLQNSALERIGENGRRLLSLIDDLLTLSRLRSSQLELAPVPVDLVEVVRAAERAILPRVRSAEISLEMDLLPSPLVVQGDAEKLERALLNLMSNAVKFTPRLGRVTIRLRTKDEAWAVVTVADTGYGIPPEDLDRLFSQFFRTSVARERHIQGTGLGLSIVRAIVESHGGHVDVESTVEVGTSFHVHLPL